MSPIPKKSVTHFTHAHPLVAADDDCEFLCDGCKTVGIGKRLRCNGCDFDLHEYCGTCPRTFSSPSVHDHPLTLFKWKVAVETSHVNRICNVCCDSVNGLFYRCKECKFDVHPLCTQMVVTTHFTHAHPLVAADDDREFLCDGCKTVGIGKRLRCNGCNFNLHEYCGTCTRTLLSPSMHDHPLTLFKPKVAVTTSHVNRICNVCCDPINRLFYRCKECEFDVHPLCTQLPEKLNHALHKIHPLRLRTSPTVGCCVVCQYSCHGWRYRCNACNFDMHYQCVLQPVVPYLQPEKFGQRGIPVSNPQPEKLGQRRIPVSNLQPEQIGKQEIPISDPQLWQRSIPMSDPQPEKLGQRRIPMFDPQPEKLGQRRIPVSNPQPEQIGKREIPMSDPQSEKLGQRRIPMSDPQPEKLEHQRIPMSDPQPEKLEHQRIPVSDPQPEKLGQWGIPMSDPQPEQIEKREMSMSDGGIMFQPPRQFAPFYGYPNYGPGFNMYYGGPYMYPPENFGRQSLEVGSSNNEETGIKKSMFSLVREIGIGVISNMVFGGDISPFFGDQG